METRPGCRVHAIIVTSCHGNNDEAWSTSCLPVTAGMRCGDLRPASDHATYACKCPWISSIVSQDVSAKIGDLSAH